MRNKRDEIRRFIWLLWLATMLLSTAACALASRSEAPALQPDISETTLADSAETSIVDEATDLICQGDFITAEELINQYNRNNPDEIDEFSTRMLQVVDEYKVINQQMEDTRKEDYNDKVAELDKLRTETDINDVNDIVSALAATLSVSELANAEQKKQLLSDPFVENIIQTSVEKATEYEAEGNWLESYTTCYAWAREIDPNNEGFDAHTEEILDKATISLSLEDSACETVDQRYEGVDKRLFINAINFLDLQYVNVLDYEQMSLKAIERCVLLGEVMAFPNEDSPETGQLSPVDYKKSLTTWLEALDALKSEIQESQSGVNKGTFLDLFDKVLGLNATTVNLPRSVLISHFSEATLSALDSYTTIVWPIQVPEFEKVMMNEFSGIGVEISKPMGLLTIASLLPDTPAYQSSLDAGDIIEAVDGIETKDMTLTCAVKKITGPQGTTVKLTIRRPGEEETREISITRGKIVVPTIRGWQRDETGQWQYMVDQDNKIGYVRLTSFAADSADDLETVLKELESQGMEAFILDLRNNTGGLLESAVDVSNKFVDKDIIVRRQPGRGRFPAYHPATKRGTHPDYPMVILVNSGSASASEIVAGALADPIHDRAVLVGTRTHGKGSVQGITLAIGGGAQLKYTMAYYHLPSGQRVESQEAMEKEGRDDWGVGPDVEVVLNSEELSKKLDVQRANDVLVREDHDNVNNEQKKYTLEETLEADRQLAIAILVLKSKLIQTEAQQQL